MEQKQCTILHCVQGGESVRVILARFRGGDGEQST